MGRRPRPSTRFTLTSGTGKGDHKEERTEATLKATVRQVFKVIKHMEHEVWYKFRRPFYHLPDEIHFVTTRN